MPKPPEERAPNNPWPEWPKTYKVDYGQEEAAAIQGDDPRQYLVSSSKFEGDADGNVKAVHVHNIEWVSENGRFMPKKVEGTERVLDAELVLLAMGFLGPESTIVEELGLEQDARSNVKADYGKFRTSVKKVFAAGDMRRGQSLIVWAINEGIGAVARECDKFLMGATASLKPRARPRHPAFCQAAPRDAAFVCPPPSPLLRRRTQIRCFCLRRPCTVDQRPCSGEVLIKEFRFSELK